ncbi:MAG: oligosaccharide flippase family protein [Lachnospiraceae bacterium]
MPFHPKKALSNLSNNLIIKGTLILTITGIITRIIGFYNRIFLSDLIGAKELGIYQLVLPIYVLSISFCIFGNELAVTKLISESENEKERKKILYFGAFISIISSIIISIILYFNANTISIYFLKAPACSNCIRILCFAIPSVAIKGCIHGYFLGLQDSSVHGISDLLEQFAKILSVYLFAAFIFKSNYYPASFAMIGIVCGEYLSLIYSIFRYIRHCHFTHTIQNKTLKNAKQTKHNLRNSDTAIHATTTKHLYTSFLKTSIPMTINRFAITLIQSIEAILIPSVLLAYYQNSDKSLSVYGIIMGISFPFIMFPATITNSLSSMLMPAVSNANSKQGNNSLKKMIENSIHFCLLIGIFSSAAFFVFGKEIGYYFFNNKDAGIYLYDLSLLCPLIYLATTYASILNGLGHITRNLIQTFIATTIRILFIVVFIPKIGITGYIIGLFVSYFFLSFASCFCITKSIHYQMSIGKSILLPYTFFFTSGYLYYFAYKKSITMFHFPYRNIIMLFVILILFCITTIGPVLLITYKARLQHR